MIKKSYTFFSQGRWVKGIKTINKIKTEIEGIYGCQLENHEEERQQKLVDKRCR